MKTKFIVWILAAFFIISCEKKEDFVQDLLTMEDVYFSDECQAMIERLNELLLIEKRSPEIEKTIHKQVANIINLFKGEDGTSFFRLNSFLQLYQNNNEYIRGTHLKATGNINYYYINQCIMQLESIASEMDIHPSGYMSPAAELVSICYYDSKVATAIDNLYLLHITNDDFTASEYFDAISPFQLDFFKIKVEDALRAAIEYQESGSTGNSGSGSSPSSIVTTGNITLQYLRLSEIMTIEKKDWNKLTPQERIDHLLKHLKEVARLEKTDLWWDLNDIFYNLPDNVSMSEGRKNVEGILKISETESCFIKLLFTNSWENNKLRIEPYEQDTEAVLGGKLRPVVNFKYPVINGTGGYQNCNVWIQVESKGYEYFRQNYTKKEE